MKKISCAFLLAAILFSCKKEEIKINHFGMASDVDGHTYFTTKINGQTWMVSNLNASRFSNGDAIMEVHSDYEWQAAILSNTPVWCYYNYDSAYGGKYGKIYNWFAVKDPRGLAPEGWSVPSHSQWSELVNFLGGSWEAGGKIKAKSGWEPGDAGQDGNGTNDYGFNSLPGGTCFSTGSFYPEGKLTKYWSSTTETTYEVYHALMSSQNKLLNQFTTSTDNGMYVRCISNK